jgi:hypothetical protein
MKKITLLSVLLISTIFIASAQFKPEAGNFGLTGSIDGLQNIKLAQQGTLGFRYFLENDLVFRLGANLGTSNSNEVTKEDGIESTLTIKQTVARNINLGIAKRFTGTDRLDPYIGIDLIIGSSGGGSTLSRTEVFDADSTFDPNDKTGDYYQSEVKTPNGFTIGIRPLVGFNYFIAPKLAIGAEFAWGFSTTTTKGSETNEEGTGITSSTVTIDSKDKSSGFGTTGATSITFTFIF